MRSLFLLLTLLGALLLGACGPATPQISVSDPWARAAAMTGMDAHGGADPAATPVAPDTSATPMADGMGAEMAAMGGTSAVYMTLVNSGGQADRLLSASTDAAQTVELHETTMENNVMRMAPVLDGIEVPANGQAELRPGGLHVMLIGLTRELAAGDTVRLTLSFERAGSVTVDAPVRAP
jgi:periplasmic copper chaperone A